MAIEIPIRASDIRDEFSYFLTDNPNEAPIDVFQISDYYGMPIYYPNGRRRPDGTPILTPSGEIQLARVLPENGPLSFSDFLGSVGYFAAYPDPTITLALGNDTFNGWSNYTLINMDVVVNVDSRNSEIVPWRPDITRREIIVEWQELNTGNNTWSTSQTRTFTDVGQAADSFGLSTRAENTYYFRVKTTAISYALNDDLVPYGGELGALREVSRSEKISDTITVDYTPYQPADPIVTPSAEDAFWNDYRGDDGARVGTYSIAKYTFDNSFPVPPDPMLRWRGTQYNPNKLGLKVVFDPAYGRSPQETVVYDWEYYDPAIDTKYDDLTVGDVGWRSINDSEYPIVPYPDDVEYGTGGHHRIQWNSVTDTSLDQIKFRMKCTATQALYDPQETNITVNYTYDDYLINVDIMPLTPDYTLTGTSGVVNGGVFTEKFRAVNMPDDHHYYWRVIADPTSSGNPTSGDFVSDSGDFELPMEFTNPRNIGEKVFQITTRFDGDTATEKFILQMFTENPTSTSTPAVSKNLTIVYGPPAYKIFVQTRVPEVDYIGYIDGVKTWSTNEDTAFTVETIIDNLGDVGYQWRYTRTYAGNDGTGEADFSYIGNFNSIPTNTTYNRDATVTESTDTKIRAGDKFTMYARKDSPYGGVATNFEQFKIELLVGGVVRDQFNLRVYDFTTYEINEWGTSYGFSSQWTYTENIDGGSVTAAAPTKSITHSNTPHVSWHTYGEGTLYYRWVVYNPYWGNKAAFNDGYNWFWATSAFSGSSKDGWAPVGSRPNTTFGTNNSQNVITNQGYNNLVFSNWKSGWRSDLQNYIQNVTWGLQFLAIAANGYGKAVNTTSKVKANITENRVYVPTGIVSVTNGRRYKEGEDMNLIIGIRTSRMNQKKVKIMLDEGGPGSYRLVGWPQFGPQHPDYSHPVSEYVDPTTKNKELIITKDYMEINMGSVFTQYNFREDTGYEMIGGLSTPDRTYIRGRVYIAPNQPGFRYDPENYERSGNHYVKDATPQVYMRSPTSLDPNRIELYAPNANQPYPKWPLKLYFTGTNVQERGILHGHGGTIQAGAGWYIVRQNDQPAVDETGISNNPEHWFEPHTSMVYAEEAGVPVPSELVFYASNWHKFSFNVVGSPNDGTNDYARSLRDNNYYAGTANNPAATIPILNPTISADKPNGKWFPTKWFTIYSTSQGSPSRTKTLYIKSRQPKPPTWRIAFDAPGDQTPPGTVKITWTIRDKDTWQVIPDAELLKHYDKEDFIGDFEVRSNLNSTGTQERNLLYIDLPGQPRKVTGNFFNNRYAILRFSDDAATISEDGTGGVYAFYPAGTLGGKGSKLFNIKKAYEDIKITLTDANKTQGDPDGLVQGVTALTTATVTGGKSDSRWTYNWSLSPVSGSGPCSISALDDPSTARVFAAECGAGKINLTVTDQYGLSKSATASFALYTVGKCMHIGGPNTPLKAYNGVGAATYSGKIEEISGPDETNITASGGIGVSGGSGNYKVSWTTTKSGAGTRSGTTASGKNLSCSMKLLNVLSFGQGEYNGTITGTATVTDTETGETATATCTLSFSWVIGGATLPDTDPTPDGCPQGYVYDFIQKKCVPDLDGDPWDPKDIYDTDPK